MTSENHSAATFQQLRDNLASVIKRIHAADSLGLPVDTLTAEAGKIMLTLRQYMEQHKGAPFCDAY